MKFLLALAISFAGPFAFANHHANRVDLIVGQSYQIGHTAITCSLTRTLPGGCNAYGCWKNGGGCNAYGCWSSPNGQCNAYGCSDNGTCNSYGCSPNGACNAYGCP